MSARPAHWPAPDPRFAEVFRTVVDLPRAVGRVSPCDDPPPPMPEAMPGAPDELGDGYRRRLRRMPRAAVEWHLLHAERHGDLPRARWLAAERRRRGPRPQDGSKGGPRDES